eukprot:GEMP01031950.1.p1 GENE.GEMP01031950.1~~GEMP01031950.1.p1  ORF type:complete len:476 (+),score=105.85 GEMP01031950.1:103-1530(+)
MKFSTFTVPHIDVRETENLGRAAYAAAKYSHGDLVLKEQPFLSFAKDSTREAANAAARMAQLADLKNDRNMMAFFMPAFLIKDGKEPATKRKLQHIPELFYSPPNHRKGRMKKYADISARLLKDVAFNTVREHVRFCHVVDLNIHRDEETSVNDPGLFVIGSKFSHSCAPNCGWQFDPEGNLIYYAIRDIDVGDLLTFSYIGDGFNLLSDTASRRPQLGRLLFLCECPRCNAPDTSRALPCPKCSEGTVVPAPPPAFTQGEFIRKAMNLEIDESFFACECEWKCDFCGVVDMPEPLLKSEHFFKSMVPMALESHPEEPERGELEKKLSLYKSADAAVGCRHWTTCLLTFAVLQRFLRTFGTDETGLLPLQKVQQLCRDMIRSIELGSGGNTIQLLRAAGLVGHLAKKYDSALCKDVWGVRGSGMPFGWPIDNLLKIGRLSYLSVLMEQQPLRLYEAEWTLPLTNGTPGAVTNGVH